MTKSNAQPSKVSLSLSAYKGGKNWFQIREVEFTLSSLIFYIKVETRIRSFSWRPKAADSPVPHFPEVLCSHTDETDCLQKVEPGRHDTLLSHGHSSQRRRGDLPSAVLGRMA